jgi:hypothetical protein
MRFVEPRSAPEAQGRSGIAAPPGPATGQKLTNSEAMKLSEAPHGAPEATDMRARQRSLLGIFMNL